MGDRPQEFARAVQSVLDQTGDPVEVVVVGNGADPGPVPAGVRVITLPSNVGIAEGRNVGTLECTGDVVLYLDDDGWYASSTVAQRIRELFAADESLAVISMRIADPDGGPGERRHVPRLRAGDPQRSSVVTTFLGGACAIRRTAFDEVGGYPSKFVFGHEETDLAWRLLDAGYALRYDADAVMCHPAAPAARHATFYRYTARNRVWLARRNLPWPIGIVYLLDWMLLTVARVRSPRALRSWFGGFAEGWREPCGERRPIRWRTALTMARAGRPPVI
jgi:GT2 family glycosyltransferase